MTARIYDRAVPSDGLTVDTDYGPVDTVALDRVRAGIRTRLSSAESEFLSSTLVHFDQRLEAAIAAGLGISASGVNRRIARARERAGLRGATSP